MNGSKHTDNGQNMGQNWIECFIQIEPKGIVVLLAEPGRSSRGIFYMQCKNDTCCNEINNSGNIFRDDINNIRNRCKKRFEQDFSLERVRFLDRERGRFVGLQSYNLNKHLYFFRKAVTQELK